MEGYALADITVIGTAGHVDHGKTALVRALTGQDTDRLPEERRRGISIDLGFAEFVLPSGRQAAIVDVPGHERFIRNMVAGATGVDLVLLVVAADEGVRPQTREHLDILQLLGVQAGAVVLSKVDLVEPDWLDLVEADVRQAVAGTFLAGAPVMRVSSVTGEGLDALRAAVDALLPRVRPRPADAFARLPVDRAFTVPGFGTVVTGTLVAGRVAVEDRLELLPHGVEVRVRQVQVHGRRVEQAQAGQRVALNLVGVAAAEVERGCVLAAPGTLRPADELALALTLLPGATAPLRHGARLRLHTGTVEVIGRAHLLEGEALQPGATGLVRFRAERPLAAARGDRFVVRTYSPMRTIGGGVVLDTGRPYRRRRAADLARLGVLARGEPAEIAAAELAAAQGPLTEADLARRLLWPPAATAEAVARLLAPGTARRLGGEWLVHAEAWQGWRERLPEVLGAYHREQPLRPGMPREELRQALGVRADVRGFAALLEDWAAAGAIALAGDVVALPGHAPGGGEGAADAERVLARWREAGLAPPTPDEAAVELGLPSARVHELVDHLVRAGSLVRLEGEHVLAREAWERAVRAVAARIARQGPATVAELRDLLGVSRKHVLPLLEAMDRALLTRRQGDRRVLTPRGARWADPGAGPGGA